MFYVDIDKHSYQQFPSDVIIVSLPVTTCSHILRVVIFSFLVFTVIELKDPCYYCLTIVSALVECTPRGCLAVSLLILMAFNAAFCLVAGILCAVEVVIMYKRQKINNIFLFMKGDCWPLRNGITDWWQILIANIRKKAFAEYQLYKKVTAQLRGGGGCAPPASSPLVDLSLYIWSGVLLDLIHLNLHILYSIFH